MAAPSTKRQMRHGFRRALPWLVVATSLVVGYAPMLPPSVVGGDAAADQFSAERAATHVSVIARQPHPLGSPAIAEVRAYVRDQLDGLGIEFDEQAFLRPDAFVPNRTAEIVNLIGRIPGTDTTGAIALIGHYDTVPETPGANDNSTAVASLLEIGRALQSGPPIRNDVILLFTDAEEPKARYGSTTFVAEHPAFAEVALAINLEASGGFGASILAEVSGPEHWMVGQLVDSGARPAAFSFVTETSRWVGDFGTDFDKFRNAGVPGFHLAYLHASSIYHTDRDNIGALSLRSLQHHGNQGLAIARHFGGLDLTTSPSEGGSVFFRTAGGHVQYPAALAIPLLLVALALTAAAAWQGHVGLPSRPGLGFAVGAAGLLLGAAAWMAMTAVRSTLGLVEGYVYYAVIVASAASGIALINRRFRPESLRGNGSTLTLLLLATVTALAAPGFSYLFVWPAIAVAAALFLPRSGYRPTLAGFGLVAFVTIVALTPAADIFLQFAHPRPGNPDSDLAPMIVVPMGLALLTIGVLRQFWPKTGADGG